MNAPKSPRRRACLVAALVLAVAWSETASGARHDPDHMMFGKENGRRVSFLPIEQGFYGVYSKPILLGVGSDSEWDKAMEELESLGALIVLPPPPPPRVDWSHQTVVLVALGRSGDHLLVREIRCKGHGKSNRLCLDVRVEQGGPTGQVDRSPYYLIAIKRRSVNEARVIYNEEAPPGLPTFTRVPGWALSPDLSRRMESEGDAPPLPGGAPKGSIAK